MDFSRVDLVVACLGFLLGAPLVVGFYLLTRRLAPRWARWAVRALLLPVLLLGFLHAWRSVGHGPRNEGSWMCTICAKSEWRATYAGFVLERGQASAEAWGASEARAFEAWFHREIGIPHEHAWLPSGGHRVGAATVACSMLHGRHPYFVRLPALADSSIAETMIRSLLAAPPEQRRPMIESVRKSELFLTDPGRLPPPAEQERALFDAWRRDDPRWD